MCVLVAAWDQAQRTPPLLLHTQLEGWEGSSNKGWAQRVGSRDRPGCPRVRLGKVRFAPGGQSWVLLPSLASPFQRLTVVSWASKIPVWSMEGELEFESPGGDTGDRQHPRPV